MSKYYDVGNTKKTNNTIRRSVRISHKTKRKLQEGSEMPSQTSNQQQESSSSTPLFTIGVIADIQWAPVPNGHSYSGVPRFYQHALEAAKVAAQHFEEEKVHLVVNLGDIIDGKCQDISIDQWPEHLHHATSHHNHHHHHATDESNMNDSGYRALLSAVNALAHYRTGPILHTYGNHELYNVNRDMLGRILNIPFVRESCGDLVGYYSYQVDPSIIQNTHKNTFHQPSLHHSDDFQPYRFIVIDSYDIAIMKRCSESSTKRKKAESILTEKNPNFPTRENSPDGLTGVHRRFVAFNGAIDTPQLTWLRTTLQEAKENNERVIILSHQPILPGSSSPMCLIWNYHDVLAILREYSTIVAAAFAGHAHKGGYKRDELSGIHFRVFEAVLESEEPIKTYAFVDLYEQHLVVRGMGHCRSAIYDLDHLTLK